MMLHSSLHPYHCKYGNSGLARVKSTAYSCSFRILEAVIGYWLLGSLVPFIDSVVPPFELSSSNLVSCVVTWLSGPIRINLSRHQGRVSLEIVLAL